MRQKGNHRCVFAFQVEEINKWTCNSNWRTIKHLWGAHQEKLRLSCRAPHRASLLLDCLVFLLTPSLALVVQLCPVGDEEDGCGKGLCVWSDTHKPAGVCVCVCVCECTCTRAQLTQSEKCCMATVHKGTRLCIRMCQVCLYVWKKGARQRRRLCAFVCMSECFGLFVCTAQADLERALHWNGVLHHTLQFLCTRCLLNRRNRCTVCVYQRHSNNTNSYCHRGAQVLNMINEIQQSELAMRNCHTLIRRASLFLPWRHQFMGVALLLRKGWQIVGCQGPFFCAKPTCVI